MINLTRQKSHPKMSSPTLWERFPGTAVYSIELTSHIQLPFHLISPPITVYLSNSTTSG